MKIRIIALMAVMMILASNLSSFTALAKPASPPADQMPAVGQAPPPDKLPLIVGEPEIHWADYLLGDSPKDANGIYEWTKRDAAAKWQRMQLMDASQIHTDHAWFRSRVPVDPSSGTMVPDPYLLFASVRYEFEVYSGSERIFQYGNLDDEAAPMMPGQPVFVSLQGHSPDKPLLLRVQSNRNSVMAGKVASVWYGNGAELKMELIREELPKALGMLVFFMIGLVSLLLHFINRDSPTYLYFALFCLAIFCNLLLSLDSFGLFMNDYTFRMYAEEPLQGVTIFFFALYFIHALKPMMHRLVRAAGIVILVAGCLMPAARLLIPEAMEAYRNEILVVKEIGLSCLCAFCLVVIVRSLRRSVDKDAKWFVAGFSLYLLINAIGHPLRLLVEHRMGFMAMPPLAFIRFLQVCLDYSLLVSTIFFGIITIRRYAALYRTTRSNNIQLANWNQTLELKVNERTQSIQNLLDYAGQGFLTFNSHMTVQAEYSAECRRLFGRDIAGASYGDLVDPGDEVERSFLDELMASIFQEDELHREVVMSLLPAESDILGKRVALQYKWIPTADAASGSSGSVMVILTDISEQRQMENRIARERQVLNMVVWVIKHYRDFKEMIEEYRTFAQEGMDELLQSELPPAEVWAELSRAIHTFKGNFAQLDFIHTTEKLHGLESRLEEWKEQAAAAADTAFAPRLAVWMGGFDLLDWIEEDLRILRDILGDRFDMGHEMITIELERLRQLEQQVYTILPSPEAQAIVSELKKLQYRPFKELLSMYPEYTVKLAERLGKELYPVDIIGGEMLVDPDVYMDFTRTLIHVFRNMADHGIETPEERASMGKKRKGAIVCEISGSEQEIRLALSNNGKVMDLAIIGQRALDMGICSTEEWLAMPEDEKRMVIFREGFSTRRSVSKLSGRGIGLSAVRKALDEIGGAVHVASSPETGTVFTFLIPRKNKS